MRRIKKAYNILKAVGIKNTLFRVKYSFLMKSGILKKKFPIRTWSEFHLSDWIQYNYPLKLDEFIKNDHANKKNFFFTSETLLGLNRLYQKPIVNNAENILQNKFQYFFYKFYDLGAEPDWCFSPITGNHAQNLKHWCDIPVFSPDVGDIKFIWEPSRFAWTYTLVRAYAATEDSRYVEGFWRLLESWLANNPPNTGYNYICGQECAIRLMAMCFAFYAFAQHSSSSLQRLTMLIIAIAVHADRVEKNIEFAISTKTNHSITESAGIYTAGLLFPEMKSAGRWHELGKAIFTQEVLKQIAQDGSYIQQSMNYHRLMLQDCLWVLRLAEINKDYFEKPLLSTIKKAADFLFQMQDMKSGRVPNYGANDGAMIFPLSTCDYLDYRPALQAINYYFTRKKLYSNGPWDEELMWFFGTEAVSSEIELKQQASTGFLSGGYYTLRNKKSWMLTRCHTFKNRPSHADMLGVDLWYQGINVLRDSGTYMYNSTTLWEDYFKSTSAHNCVVIDRFDQMTKGTRFLWFDWTKSKTIFFKYFEKERIGIFQGEHYGYCRKDCSVIHRRAILSVKDIWVIVDDLVGRGNHEVQALWNLVDCEIDFGNNRVLLNTEKGPVFLFVADSNESMQCFYLKGDERIPAGWDSPYYGQRWPAPVLILSGKTDLPVRIVTLVSLGNIVTHVTYKNETKLSWHLRNHVEEETLVLNSIAHSENLVFQEYTESGQQKNF